ncbi:MAG: CocE/NonD family hydrolase [Burkholderiaceae bacterium]
MVPQEIFFTTSDNVKLGGRLLLPQGVPGEARPCVLLADGYGHTSTTGAGVEPPLMDLATRGYAGLHLSMRGSGNSEGEANLYNKFGEDGYEVIEWMAKQPWCNGRVGMVGASLLGISQWLTARKTPPSLKAIIPHVACGNCYDYVWYPGGMLPGPGRVARGAVEYGSASQHRDFDAYWQERTTLSADHQRIAAQGIAVLTTGGWNDYISPANLEAYEDMPANAAKMMIWGPDAHGTMLKDVQPWSFFEYQAMWMDRHLRGIDNGVGSNGQALIYVQGPDQWRTESQWPIPDTQAVRLHLRADRSGSIGSINDGSLQPAAPADAAGAATISYSEQAGPFLPTLLSSSQGRYKADQRPVETRALTWTTRQLPVATEVTGRARLAFWASIHGQDADFVVQLTDVAPDGTSTQVTVGYLNASHADSRAAPQPVAQDTPKSYELNLWPTSYVFRAGHRIRIDLAGGAQAGTDLPGPQGPGKSPYDAVISILQDAGHPASIELPTIGTGGQQLVSN